MVVVGGTLGRFKIVERLGRGGMASVFKAFDPRFERHVALKVLSLDLAADPNFRQRFEREMKTLARLDHPNIAQIHDSGEEGETFYMVLQYFPDGDLRSRLAQRLPLYEVVRILREIAKGLAHAHRLGIVHRDIKPANVLFSSEGRPVLADFGIAKLMAETVQFTQEMSGPGVGIGTPQYMSPEQVQGREIDARSDVYAFGVLAYEMFVGQPPFTGDTPIAVALKHLNDDFPRPTVSIPDFPPAIEEFVLKCVARDPEERFENGTALVAALEALARGIDGHATEFPTLALRLDTASATTATMRRDEGGTSPTMTMPSQTPRPATRTAATTSTRGAATRGAATRATATRTTSARVTGTGARPATRYGAEPPYAEPGSEEFEGEWQEEAAPARKKTGLIVGLVALVAAVAIGAGLLLFRKDTTAPGAVALDARNATASTVELTWSAPGDNGLSGQAVAYEVRQSDRPIAPSDWEALRGVAGVGAPRPAGEAERLVVTGLDPQRDYFFALRARDDAGNWSPISNVASARTLALPRGEPGIGTLLVRTTPADATVIVDGGEAGRGPEARFDSLAAGTHTIEVMHDGHATERRSVTVLAGLTESVDVALADAATPAAVAETKARDADAGRASVKAPDAAEATGGKGILEVRTDIAARILVDGEVKKENADLVRLTLEPGTHRVRIEKEGFVPKDTSVVVSAKRPASINLTIERNLATIEITSNVAAALIIDDDVKEVNSGFARARVSPGRHVVRAEAAGYPTQEREVNVATGAVAAVEFEFTAEKRGSLRVTVKGEPAFFFIDGVKADCPTPCVVENVAPGTHTLVAERGGVRGEMTILVRAGERLDVDVTPLFLGK